MEFRILGPLESVHGGAPVDIKGTRQRTVLALLLLEANHIVPTDRLVDGVWDKAPPTTSRGQIQICISSLRRQLPAAALPGLITTRSPGYRLRVADGQLDLHAFESGVAAGRRAAAERQPKRAVREFRAALDLWHGPALAGIDSRLVRHGVAHLDERRLVVHEECLELELATGAPHGPAGELLALVAAHPLRERLRVLLMTALYRAGRQAEALEEYRKAREILIEELGIEPGEDLRRLHRAILSGDPDLVRPTAPAMIEPVVIAPTRVPRLLPTDFADFTGRADLARELTRPRETAGTGTAVPITVVTGRCGVGKTTLAVHAAHRLAPDFPDGQLFAHLTSADGPVDPRDVLGRFLRALGLSGSAIPDGLEERAETYRDLLAGRRVLVVLDDATAESQVLPLLPGTPRCRVLVTSRRRFTGLPAADRLEVPAFDPDGSVELLARIAGRHRIAAEPDAAAALCAACEHLPLALRIVATRLAARPHWSVSDLVARLGNGSRRLDELCYGEVSVRGSIAPTYEGLTPEARRLFRLLALLQAPGFASWVGAPLLGTDPLRAQDPLEELAECYLLDVEVNAGTGVARYRFPELVYTFARERLAADEPPGVRRAALERTLGVLLFLLGEARRRQRGAASSGPHAGGRQRVFSAELVERLLADPLAWYAQERPWILAAIRQAAAAGFLEHARGLAMSTITLSEARTHPDAGHAVVGFGDELVETASAPDASTRALRAHLRLAEADVGPGEHAGGFRTLLDPADAGYGRGEERQAGVLAVAARALAANMPRPRAGSAPSSPVGERSEPGLESGAFGSGAGPVGDAGAWVRAVIPQVRALRAEGCPSGGSGAATVRAE
ncbi:BTAD domain-containing putative transcriptional regulator [Embleya sp. MST-111070]|uniref:AfsR/SARP family transcriptional regulator n=1 Tax=Embleya sp. MST-111070 TaxID=3398231 RepID=UPI003F732F19